MRSLIGVIAFTFALNGFGQQYPFLPVPGAPNSLQKLFQDSRGRLWLEGTNLSCFDGSHFYSLSDYGLPPGLSLDVAEDSSGAIWIGTEIGVFRFWNGRVEKIAVGSASSVVPISPDIIVAVIGPTGRTVPNTDVFLVRLKRTGAHWSADSVMILGSPGPLTLDRLGSLLYPWPGKGWNEIRSADIIAWRPGAPPPIMHHAAEFPVNAGDVKVMRDHDGCIWLGAGGGAGSNIFTCDGRHFSHPIDNVRLRANFHEASDGTMVLWGDSALAIGRKGSFRVAAPENGLPGIADALLANDGTAWLSSSSGLYRFASPFRLEYWTAREGLRPAPWSITKSAGRVYVGIDHAIMALSADRLRWDLFASLPLGGAVTGLLGASDGTLLVSSMAGVSIHLTPVGRTLAHTENTALGGMRLLRTADGETWLGGPNFGRVIRQGPSLATQNHPLQNRSYNVLGLKYEPHTRKLWACYEGGAVVRDENGGWREFTTRDGLLVNGCWSLAPLPNGDVWYAYMGAPAIGLIRTNPSGQITVRQYGANEGAGGTDALELDQETRLWREGLYVADPSQAESANWMELNESDGFPTTSINSGSFFVDPDGSLWWGADNDLVHYTPHADLVDPKFAPNVFLSAFSWGGSPPKLVEAVYAIPHAATLTVHIGSLQFDRRNSLRLRYRLLPDQPSWRETKSLDLALGVLPSGSHTIEVQARLFTGPWSPTVRRSFSVLPSIWLSSRYFLTYSLIAFISFVSFYLLQRQRRRAQQSLMPDLGSWRLGALMPETHDLLGATLDGRYEVGALIARGGFASVMSGRDLAEKRPCAIKIFRGDVKNRASLLRGFEQEVSALRQIHHPNVVSIYADGLTPSGAPYLAMEFVAGKSLRDILKDGPLPRPRVGRLLRQLAGALDAIHLRGICHRDVKPENVIVRQADGLTEEAVLIDFSIAIIKDANETLYGLSRAAGTFDYMAPEQAMGHAQPASDVFSLAKLAIEMLTGRRVAHLLPNAALDLPERVRELLKSFKLSEDSIEMLARALEFDPKNRPSVAGAFIAPIVRDLG